jgi:hypothetical protein
LPVSKPLVIRCLVATVVLVCSWLPQAVRGQPQDAALDLVVTSTPPLEEIRPLVDLAHLTLTVQRHGKALRQGHVQMQLTAPPRARFLATGFPRVEGTVLLALDSDLSAGALTFKYRFPIRGTYRVDLRLEPRPGEEALPPTHVSQTFHIAEDPVVLRNAWLLVIGLFVLGSITGVIFARSVSARDKLLASALIGPFVLLYSSLIPMQTVSADTSPTPLPQVMQGAQGWRLAVDATPMPATVGQLLNFAIWLRQNGTLWPGAMTVALAVVDQESGATVLENELTTPQGHTVQGLQVYDGAPHTVILTARPMGAAQDIAPLTATVDLAVIAPHPPMAVKLRMMAILLGVLVAGMVVGFLVPRVYKEPAGG